MKKETYKLESIACGYAAAKSASDRVRQYRCCVALLNEVLEQHKTLESDCGDIDRLARELDKLKTEHTVSQVHEYHSSGRGRRRSGYWIGREGHRIQPIEVADKTKYISLLTELCHKQMTLNSDLAILKQYATQFAVMRDELTELRPVNTVERTIQNVLLCSVPSTTWGKECQTHNTILGTISGKFANLYNRYGMSRVLKQLTATRGKIGRRSLVDGRLFLERHQYTNLKLVRDYERYTGKRSKAERCNDVKRYISDSKLYRDRLGWIVSLSSVSDALTVLPFVDEWKEKYEATNRLGYLTAAKKNPYVNTIIIERPVQIGTMPVLDCSVPIYRTKGILWEHSRRPEQHVYFLGRSGSEVVDKILLNCDWYHQTTAFDESDPSNIQTLVATFNTRMRYVLTKEQTAKQRRHEIASYARKLIWLESINMTDSKSAGNCLPGTIQFAKSMNLPCPSSWKDYTVDARTLLRKWKEKNYDCDRLFLPAIDAAVNRVKQTLASLTVSCYVPSVIR